MADRRGRGRQPQQQAKPVAKRKPVFETVNSLQPGQSTGHNLVVKVCGESKEAVNKLRNDGKRIRIVEALVGDSSACITFSARDEQAELMTPGTTLVIRNGRVDMFKGVMRLSVDKWGKLERAPDDPSYTGFQPNTTHNLSATVYELVPMEE